MKKIHLLVLSGISDGVKVEKIKMTIYNYNKSPFNLTLYLLKSQNGNAKLKRWLCRVIISAFSNKKHESFFKLMFKYEKPL